MAIWLLSSCAAPPRVAPRFVQPSTAPIARAQAAVKADVQRAEVIVKRVGKECPQAKQDVEILHATLDQALGDLTNSEDARDQLDMELRAQTAVANTLATNYDRLHAENEKAQAIVKRVNSFWGLGAFTYGAGRLIKHLFILLAVLAVLAIAILILSFFFPFIVPFIRTIGSFFAAVLNKIRALLKR